MCKKQAAYVQRHPQRQLAHRVTRRAIAANKIAHPTSLKCQGCNEQAEHYHHDDYSKPLDVVALCRKCHENLHIEQKRTQS